MKESRTKDIFVLGFAMFAIFFGAGNLIFPPSIGINTGEDVIFGIAGMTLTGILFPMLAMYAVVNMGTDFHDLSYRHRFPRPVLPHQLLVAPAVPGHRPADRPVRHHSPLRRSGG